ncbi:MAG: DUF2788 domain-containing protein [Pseudomonadota bacterium]|jgi:hypothetical protein
MFGLSLPELEEITLQVGLSGLILYMMFIIYDLAKESKAGKLGTLVLFFTLGLGMFGFAAKQVIAKAVGIE